jgi:hypothetical protein
MVEGNLHQVLACQMAQEIVQKVPLQYQPVFPMRVVPKTGVHPQACVMVDTHLGKECMQQVVNRYLNRGSLFIAQNFISREPQMVTKLLEQQLLNAKRIVSVSNHPEFVKPRIQISGKIGGHKDDLMMATMVGMYWMTMYELRHAYVDPRRIGSVGDTDTQQFAQEHAATWSRVAQ